MTPTLERVLPSFPTGNATSLQAPHPLRRAAPSSYTPLAAFHLGGEPYQPTTTKPLLTVRTCF